MSGRPAVHAEHVTFRYSGATRCALRDISFEVAEGVSWALLGPNGAGKTTLVNLICGLSQPAKGAISVFGGPVKTAVRRGRIGLCPQELALHPKLTGRENLAFFAGLAGLRGRDLGRAVNSVLSTVGLDQASERRVEAYSGGMKRRLNVAVALCHGPELVLLDEATVGVDPESREMLFRALESLETFGTTVLYSTHQLEEAERLCSHVAIMDEGRIVAAGPTGEVIGTGDRMLFHVEFNQDVPDGLWEELALKGWIVRSARKREGDFIAPDEDVLGAVVEMSAKHGLQVRGLSRRACRLEDVYFLLTRRRGRHAT